MTVSAITSRIVYSATTNQTNFVIPFDFFENTDLKIYKNSVILTISTDYTISGQTLILSTGATLNDIISIIRDSTFARLTSFEQSGPFRASSINSELDNIWLSLQEINDRPYILTSPVDTQPLSLPAPADRANRVISFSADGYSILAQDPIGNYRYTWSASTQYYNRDLVKTSNGSIYLCIEDHVSTTTFDPSKFDVIIDAPAMGGATSVAFFDTFTADGVGTDYILTYNAGTISNTNVFVNGVYQKKSTYTYDDVNKKITLPVITNGYTVEIQYGTPTITTVADGTITLAKLATGTADTYLGYDSSGNPTTKTVSIPSGSFKNVIINGDFNVWQRGTSITGTGTPTALTLMTSYCSVQTTSSYGMSWGTPSYAIDNNTGTTATCSTSVPQDLRITMNTPTIVNKYQYIPVAGSGLPTAWTFAGSNDNTNWTVLDTQSTTPTGGSWWYSSTLSNTTPYLYYRINVPTTTNGGGYAVGEVLFYTPAAPTGFTADRWYSYGANSGSSYTVSQQTSGLVDTPYCLRFTRTSSNTNTGNLGLAQSIESITAKKYQGKTITLSFRARSGSGFSASGSALNVSVPVGTGTDQGSASMVGGSWTGQSNNNSTITLTTSWQTFTKTITVPSNATELGVWFYYTPTGTASNDYYEITAVQIEDSTSATNFEILPYDIQLYRCKRYLQVLGGSTAYEYIGTGVNTNTGNGVVFVPFTVSMRTNPTITFSAYSDWTISNAGTLCAVSGINWSQSTFTGTTLSLVSSGLTTNSGILLTSNNNVNARIYASAEM